MSPWWVGAALGVSFAMALWKVRAVTLDGALAGAMLLTVMVALGGWAVSLGFALLVIIGTLASQWRRHRQSSSAAEPQKPRSGRNAGQALANAGLPALVLCFPPSLMDSEFAQLLALGGLGAAFSDTISGEVGIGLGATSRLLLVGPPVRPGRNGGMSWQGTTGGLVAAAAMASLSLQADGGSRAAVAVFAGGLSGTLIDSVLGATVERYLPKAVANDLVNVTSVSLAMMVVGILAHQTLGLSL